MERTISNSRLHGRPHHARFFSRFCPHQSINPRPEFCNGSPRCSPPSSGTDLTSSSPSPPGPPSPNEFGSFHTYLWAPSQSRGSFSPGSPQIPEDSAVRKTLPPSLPAGSSPKRQTSPPSSPPWATGSAASWASPRQATGTRNLASWENTQQATGTTNLCRRHFSPPTKPSAAPCPAGLPTQALRHPTAMATNPRSSHRVGQRFRPAVPPSGHLVAAALRRCPMVRQHPARILSLNGGGEILARAPNPQRPRSSTLSQRSGTIHRCCRLGRLFMRP